MAEKFPRLGPYAAKLETVFEGLRDLPLETLEEIRREISGLSVTNCGWSTYEAGKLIRSEVECAIRSQMNQKK